MQYISAQQVKAARALLNWKQEHLATAAKLGVSSIRSFETGYVPRPSTVSAIRRAIENAGIEFIDGEGVKRHTPEIKIYKKSDGCDQFLDHMSQAVANNKSEVFAVIQSQDVLDQLYVDSRCGHFQRLRRIGSQTEIKFLISDALCLASMNSFFQTRSIPQYAIGPSSCFIYDSHYAYIIPEGRDDLLIVDFGIAGVSFSYRKYFHFFWDNAVSLPKKKSV